MAGGIGVAFWYAVTAVLEYQSGGDRRVTTRVKAASFSECLDLLAVPEIAGLFSPDDEIISIVRLPGVAE